MDQIAADYVQLSVCEYGLRNDDVGGRIWLAVFSAHQHDRLYGGFSVCTDYFFKFRSVAANYYGYVPADEQQTGILQHYFSG